MLGETFHFLHFADLHFASHLDAATIENYVRESININGLVCQIADSAVYSQLKDTLDNYLSSNGLSGFDATFLTGDICTNPIDSSSFNLPYEFLTKNIYAAQPKGLSLNPDLLFSVPGNHDKMLDLSMDKYENSPFNPPKTINDKGDYLLSLKLGMLKPDILIYGLNSNRIDERVPAMGRIDMRQVTDMRNCIREISDPTAAWSDRGFTVRKKGKQVSVETDYAKFDQSFDLTFKILVMHHHPNRKIYKQFLLSEKNVAKKFGLATRLMDMIYDEAHNEFIKLIEENPFDLILHGHLHKPAIYRLGHSLVVAAGSTCEKSTRNSGNSFNIIKLSHWMQPEVEITTFVYDKNDKVRQFVPYGWKSNRNLFTFRKEFQLTGLKKGCKISTVSSAQFALVRATSKYLKNIFK